MRRLARTATDWTPPTGFRGKLQVDEDGTLDIKRGAIIPISNLARFHAIAAGVTISSTVARLQAAEAEGRSTPIPPRRFRKPSSWPPGYASITRSSCVNRGEAANNLIVARRPAAAHAGTVEGRIQGDHRAQHLLSRYVPYGM